MFVDSVSEINYGIWHAAIVNATHLHLLGYEVELWFPKTSVEIPADVSAVMIADTKLDTLKRLIVERNLNPKTDVVITHGVWQFPTRWGSYLKSQGYKWVYVPQGMLEPWPLQQKWLKKKIYFNFSEKNMVRKADLIRAVSTPELANLIIKFPGKRIEFIPNGVKTPYLTIQPTNHSNPRIYLFLSRLHQKKNVVTLAQAWLSSTLNQDPNAQLVIAGPDQGELPGLNEIIHQTSNIKYVGSVFGQEKYELFQNSHFFVLPLFSEGLPSSLLEAMAYGLIPIISPGCNLPDVGKYKLGWMIGTTERAS